MSSTHMFNIMLITLFLQIPRFETEAQDNSPIKGAQPAMGPRLTWTQVFLTLKKVHPNLKSKFIMKSAPIFAMFCLIFNRLLKNLFFECPFASPMILFLSYLVKNSIYRVAEVSYEMVSSAHVRQLTVFLSQITRHSNNVLRHYKFFRMLDLSESVSRSSIYLVHISVIFKSEVQNTCFDNLVFAVHLPVPMKTGETLLKTLSQSGADLGGGCRGCAPLPPPWDEAFFVFAFKDVRAHCYLRISSAHGIHWPRACHVIFKRAHQVENSTKYRADDLCVNLVCEYFCWMLGDPHFFFGRSLPFLILSIILRKQRKSVRGKF